MKYCIYFCLWCEKKDKYRMYAETEWKPVTEEIICMVREMAVTVSHSICPTCAHGMLSKVVPAQPKNGVSNGNLPAA